MHRRRPRRGPGTGAGITDTGSTVAARTHEYPRSHWHHHRRDLGCAGFFCLLVYVHGLPTPSRASSLPQGTRGTQPLCSPQNPVGAGLARDGGGTFSLPVTDTPLSQASPLPQWTRGTQPLCSPQNPVGAELARDGGGTFSLPVTDTPLSRASPLPQGTRGYTTSMLATKPCGSRACSRWRRSVCRGKPRQKNGTFRCRSFSHSGLYLRAASHDFNSSA